MIKKKFTGSPEATVALADTQEGAPNSPQVHALANQLARAESSDPEFAADLRAVWVQVSAQQQTNNGGSVDLAIAASYGGNLQELQSP